MDFGTQILTYMQQKKFRIRAYNIVYIEGVDPDTFALNDDTIDLWNDTRNVIRDDGTILMSCVATTEPGIYYTEHPMNPKGAARIAFGQYLDAWEFGDHHGQDALIQCGLIKVCRDFNEDGFRTGDSIDEGDDFYIDQHTTSDAPPTIGRWSAGCLVGLHPETHAKFMQLNRDSGRDRFDTTILDGSELHRLKVFGC